MQIRYINVILIAVFFLVSFKILQEKEITVYLIGDSTMSVKDRDKYPETGWGMPFVHFFDSTVFIENRAKNGRSTKSFIAENLWGPIASSLQEGDYVFIQFGHNDEVKEKVGRYTTPEEYEENLLKFVNETKAKNARPVLLTPVSRRKFDNQGRVVENHLIYSDIVRSVAQENDIPLIDMDKKSQELLQEFGAEDSRLLFLQLKPGEHPNYPEGKEDNTHFNELGARLIAQIVLAEIRNLNLALEEHIVHPK